MDSSAAVLDTGLEDISFLRLWNEAIRKYHVLQELEEMYERAEQEGNDDARTQALKEEAVALAQAVHALKKLGNNEARRKLEEYQAFLDGSATPTLLVGYSSKLLNSFSPDWWVLAFTDLFFRGDFREQRGVRLRRWLKVLLQRVDFLGWASSKEVAVAGR